ncbi:MAG TPA: NAD(P)-dependent oxidoreductase [Kiritimatiellia bacterium]|nr:NAD(P)-dependent oxidoreductase [Kiritimatiellia bacterium]HMO97983.1 NAD(P)-dependent oxidoreductase [Kiritimatiellia bacterium]HMP95334.1 NAD(P)-dependent oxidoreductase [Kiritimatiellia bacterium]
MRKVLIPTKLNRIVKDTLEGHGGYQVVLEETKDLKALVSQHPDTYAMIVRSEKVTPEIIDLLPALKVVVRAGSGYDNIDTKYARRRGIDVMTTPGANANAVAEEVIALMLADARHLIAADQSCRAGKWEKNLFMGRELSGKTIGIVGLGAIGQLVAKRLAGFEVKLLGYDPVISQERARSVDVELVDLKTLFERSDYITLHIPENTETRGLVNADLLAVMKEGATLVNCARSGILNEADFRTAKPAKKLRLLNDVYPKDAEGPKTVTDIADIMVPHLGASTKEANYKAALHAAEELIEFDEKGISSYIVNRDIPAGLDEAYGELAYLLARLCRQLVGRDAKLKLIESSFYGTLKPFANWLLVPVVAALSEDFDRSSDYKAAVQYLKERGIDYENREPDDRKGYENSITLDLTASVGNDLLRRSSVRGTVTEGVLMISRINDFHSLYFEPTGHAAVFIYNDRPGVLGQIGAALAGAGINIDDVRNPHDSKCEKSIAIIKVNRKVATETLDKIAAEIHADTWFTIDFQASEHRG